MLFEGSSLTKSPAEFAWSNPHHYGTHIGYTTELEPILFDISQATGLLSLENRYKKSDERNAFLLQDRDRELCGKKILNIFGQIEELVGAVGPSLIQNFRTAINRYFPIVEEPFFNAYERRQKQNLDPTLLASVYIVAATALGDGIQASVKSILDVDELEELAFRLFEESLSKPALSTVQAGLLLIQSPNCDSNIMNTQLIGIAHELGLHLDCSLWKLEDDETFLRKRLAWALFMQDKWCSLIHGRPSLIAKAHWAVQQLCKTEFPIDSDASRSDGAAADEAKRGHDLFTQLVDLTEILATVLDTFYTLQAMTEVDKTGENGTRLILEKAKPVQIRLKEWFTHLPLSLKMDNNSSGKPSSTGSLCFLFSRVFTSSLSTDLSFFFQDISTLLTLRPKLHYIAVSSAPSMPQAPITISHTFAARPPKPASFPPWTLSIDSDPSTYHPFGIFPPRSTLLSSPLLEAYYWRQPRARKRPIFTALAW